MTVHETRTDWTEREWVRAAQLGDASAFKALYERHRDRVYNMAYYLLGDPLWAEDVIQTVFLKLHRGLPGFRFEASFATWVYRIALNECQNQWKRCKARHVPLDEVLGSADEIDAESSPDQAYREKQRREVIHQAVMELSPKLRAAVALKYFEDLSYEEIASVLECAPGTVASRMNRALLQMEERLRPLKPLL